MALVLVTPPDIEPVSVDEAKTHLRVDTDTDDALIGSLIAVARWHAEQITRRALITQTWDLVLDAFPGSDRIKIPLPPLQSVSSVTYKDENGHESTMAAADTIVSTAKEPGQVVLATGKTWPSTTLYPVDAVTVRFAAGYGDAASDVPEPIRQAMLLMIGEWYENRENAGEARLSQISLSAEALLWPHRVMGF